MPWRLLWWQQHNLLGKGMQRVQGLPGPREVRSLAGRREAGLSRVLGLSAVCAALPPWELVRRGRDPSSVPFVFSGVCLHASCGHLGTHVMWHTRTPEIKPGFSARRASGRLEQGLSVRVKSSCAYLAVYSGSTLLEVEKLPKIIDWGKDQRWPRSRLSPHLDKVVSQQGTLVLCTPRPRIFAPFMWLSFQPTREVGFQFPSWVLSMC